MITKCLCAVQFVKDLHISFVSGIESIIEEIVTVLTHYQKKILMVLEPTFIEIIHHIDSTFWASSKNLIGNIVYFFGVKLTESF